MGPGGAGAAGAAGREGGESGGVIGKEENSKGKRAAWLVGRVSRERVKGGMEMARAWLRVQAPFAAFRGMQAGVYRTTAPVIPFSAAWGLVLNLAGIDTREDGSRVTTLVRKDVPCLRLAIGEMRRAEVSTLYQQLHSYPVGTSGKELREKTRGAKYWIAPVRREVLVGLDVVIGVETGEERLLARVRRGLAGDWNSDRYGLPFAGDNNFLLDRVDVFDEPLEWEVGWYVPLRPGDAPRRGSCRLTVGIDREDNSRTTSVLCAPLERPSREPPEEAWIWTPREPGRGA